MELVANRSVVELELRRALASRRSNPKNTVLLLRAAPQWHGETEFSVEDKGRQVPVTVAPCATVLAVLDALAADRPDGQYLVVLTPCDTREVGDSVLAQAMQPEIKPVDRWDLVKDAFGALRLDPALTEEGQPLDRRGAARRPARRRLAPPVRHRAQPGHRPEPAGRHPPGHRGRRRLPGGRRRPAPVDHRPRRRRDLPPPPRGRTGRAHRLAHGDHGRRRGRRLRDGPAGKIPDAVPFGLAAAALYGPPVHAQAARTEPASGTDEAVIARVRAEERYLGGKSPDADALRAFGEAAESLVTRWADNGHAAAGSRALRAGRGDPRRTGRHRGRQAGPGQPLPRARSRPRRPVRRPGRRAHRRVAERPRAAAPTLCPPPRRRWAGSARTAASGTGTARSAPPPTPSGWPAGSPRPSQPPATLAEAATRMLRSWAWADRALASIARADTSRVPRLAQAYATLWDRARARRAQLDADFARKLAAWTEASSASDDLLLVENLLDRIARPVARAAAPGHRRARRHDRRRRLRSSPRSSPAAAAGSRLAAATTAVNPPSPPSRRSPRSPGPACSPARSGPAARPRSAPASPPSGAGASPRSSTRPTSPPSLAGPSPARSATRSPSPDTVVGVVLNTIDDALDKGKPGPAHWTIDEVTYLRPVLDEARRAGRPVILTADHGHVLDWVQATGRRPRPARTRRARLSPTPPATGPACPGPGEIAVRGPRVLIPGRAAGAPAAERSSPRSTRPSTTRPGRRATTAARPRPRSSSRSHPAPVRVPAPGRLVRLRRRRPRPRLVGRPGTARTATAAGRRCRSSDWQPGQRRPRRKRRRARRSRRRQRALRRQRRQRPRLAARRTGLPVGRSGTRSAGGSPRRPGWPASASSIRRAPAEADVAALIDGLAQAGGRLTIAEAAAVAGEPAVRMSRYLAQVARLLNVDSYAVLRPPEADRTVELNMPLLRQQFLGE